MIDEAIFKKALERVFKPEKCFEQFKQSLFSKMNERRQYIIKRLVKTQVDEELSNAIIDDKHNNTKEEIKKNYLNIIQAINIDELWKESDSMITSILSSQNYDEALKICCLEHGEIISGLGNRIIPDYVSIALGVLRSDRQLAKVIRDKYFPNISI